jgi:hypothetical protein
MSRIGGKKLLGVNDHVRIMIDYKIASQSGPQRKRGNVLAFRSGQAFKNSSACRVWGGARMGWTKSTVGLVVAASVLLANAARTEDHPKIAVGRASQIRWRLVHGSRSIYRWAGDAPWSK